MVHIILNFFYVFGVFKDWDKNSPVNAQTYFRGGHFQLNKKNVRNLLKCVHDNLITWSIFYYRYM